MQLSFYNLSKFLFNNQNQVVTNVSDRAELLRRLDHASISNESYYAIVKMHVHCTCSNIHTHTQGTRNTCHDCLRKLVRMMLTFSRL